MAELIAIKHPSCACGGPGNYRLIGRHGAFVRGPYCAGCGLRELRREQWAEAVLEASLAAGIAESEKLMEEPRG